MSDFFTTVDNMRVIERNIQRLQGIEERQAKNMLKVFMLGRERIKESMTLTSQGTFTEAQLQILNVQIDAIMQSMKLEYDRRAVNSSEVVQEQSVDDLGREINRFSKEFEGITRPIPTDEILLSLDSNNILINQYQSSLDRYSEEMRGIIQREISQALISSEPDIRVINRINDQLKTQEWKVLRIARTELHNIYNMGKNEGMIGIKNDLIPDLKKSLFHPMDSRTAADSKKAARLNLVVDIDKPFKYNFNGTTRIFMNPPDRPNDRSIIVPYREEWDR